MFILVLFLCIKVVSFYNSNSLVFNYYNGFEVIGDTIVGCNFEGGNLIIPSVIDGVEVKKIGDKAFVGIGLESVYLPDSIISIGDYAFANNKLKSVKIPESVKEIGEGAFIHNNISNLEISDSVILGNASFNDNYLEVNKAFFYRDNELVSYGGNIKGNVVIPDISVIGEKAFFQTYIISVSIPNTVTTIKSNAFQNNYLVELYLSENIKDIADNAFSDNSYLSEIVINNNENSLIDYPWGASNSSLYWLK